MHKLAEQYKICDIHKEIDKLKNVNRSFRGAQQFDPASKTSRNEKRPINTNVNATISEEEKIKQILSKSIVIEDNDENTLGRDMLQIAKEYTDPKNRYLFGHMTQMLIWEDSLLAAAAANMKNDPTLKDLYEFIQEFRFSYHTGRSAIKGQMRRDFTEFGSALLAFRGALEWRQAGTIQNEVSDARKEGILEKLRK